MKEAMFQTMFNARSFISFDEVTNILSYSTLPKIVLLNFNEIMFHSERWIQLSLDFVLVPLYFVLSRFAVYYS